MSLCGGGDIHGRLDDMHGGVLACMATLGVRFAFVLHVGDFGVWPDPARIDGATKRNDGAGDFAAWLAKRRAAPRQTVFIKEITSTSSGSTRSRTPRCCPACATSATATAMSWLRTGKKDVGVGGSGGY